MSEHDCHLNGKTISRWDWIRNQIEDFASSAKPILPGGFSLITFNDRITRTDQCTEIQLLQIFKQEKPNGDTYLARALHDVLSKGNTSNKPLAIIVITDGMPTDIAAVEPILAIATRKEAKTKIKILFLGIGDGADDAYLRTMRESLIYFGARANSISYLPFKTLEAQGLARAIEELAKTGTE